MARAGIPTSRSSNHCPCSRHRKGRPVPSLAREGASREWSKVASQRVLMARLSLLLQRKEFDVLVPGHPGLRVGSRGGLVSIDVVIDQ